MSSSKALMKVLTTPSKIASNLDWRKASGSVLSIDIHKDHIGLAIASHPSHGNKTSVVESIKLAKKGKVGQECKKRLSELVREHRVCGFVVSFPLQKDTGRTGAACGRTLHTLDDLLSKTDVISANRPLCLWDSVHPKAEADDEWGRSAAYTETSDKQIHEASTEQYNQHENMVASQVWDDFCRANWPDIHIEQKPKETRTRSTITETLENEDWDDSASYVKAALL